MPDLIIDTIYAVNTNLDEPTVSVGINVFDDITQFYVSTDSYLHLYELCLVNQPHKTCTGMDGDYCVGCAVTSSDWIIVKFHRKTYKSIKYIIPNISNLLPAVDAIMHIHKDTFVIYSTCNINNIYIVSSKKVTSISKLIVDYLKTLNFKSTWFEINTTYNKLFITIYGQQELLILELYDFKIMNHKYIKYGNQIRIFNKQYVCIYNLCDDWIIYDNSLESIFHIKKYTNIFDVKILNVVDGYILYKYGYLIENESIQLFDVYRNVAYYCDFGYVPTFDICDIKYYKGCFKIIYTNSYGDFIKTKIIKLPVRPPSIKNDLDFILD